MEKGYYHTYVLFTAIFFLVAIHNKNGKGLLLVRKESVDIDDRESQSTIKMEKGYYKKSLEEIQKEVKSRNPQ